MLLRVLVADYHFENDYYSHLVQCLKAFFKNIYLFILWHAGSSLLGTGFSLVVLHELQSARVQ